MHSNDTGAGPPVVWSGGEVMWCLTLTRGIRPPERRTRFGARAGEALPMDPREADRLGRPIGDKGLGATGLRLGAIADWSSCLEFWGWLGSMAALLTRLFHATETFSLQQDARGMQRLQFWQNGHRMEVFERGMPSTRPEPPHPWWDAVEHRRNESGAEFPGWGPVLRAVADHTGATLDVETVNSRLLTVLLHDSSPGTCVNSPERRKSLDCGLRLIQNADNPQEPP